ncbi:class I SAM-dependent methyltransferase [[Eubacterium] cellulosolvens]
MRTICAKVPKVRGDYFRKKLLEAQFIDRNLIIKRNGNFLYIPLQTHPSEQWLNEFNELELTEYDFKLYPERVQDYRALITLPPELTQQLPRSYDIIGSIAILKLPLGLTAYGKQIGEAIIRAHKNIHTVAVDKGVKGMQRVRNMEIIAGEPQTETMHKEYGVRLLMDIMKVYFSPRLSTEHYRITKLVQPGEIVLDMFAGIGPFSIMIAKHSKAKRIFSIDINKHAIEYLIKNIDLNKVFNIFPMEGAVEEMIKRIPKVDRIIMNLPMSGNEHLPEAFAVLKNTGTIHYHEMLPCQELQQRKMSLAEISKHHGFEIIALHEHNLGSYSPSINHYCFDLLLKIIG